MSAKRIIPLFSVILLCLQLTSADARNLEEKFQIGKPQAHYLVLMDTSGSMKPYFVEVRDAMRMLVSALPGEDLLTSYRFDDYPVRVCAGPIRGLAVLQCVPEDFNHDPNSKTEMGEAFERAMDEIEASPAPISVIFFLTDGKEEPRRGSRFQTAHAASWAALRDRARLVRTHKEIWGYGLGLGRYTDVSLLSTIIDPARVEVIVLRDPKDLQNRIEGLRERVKRNLLKTAVRQELEKGSLELVQVQPPRAEGERIVTSYTIKSTYPHLDVAPLSVPVSGHSSNLELAPAGPLTIRTNGTSQPIAVSFARPAQPRWKLGRTTVVEKTTLTFVAKPIFTDADEISGLGLKPDPTLKGFETSVSYSYKVGIPVSFLVLVIISIVTFVLAVRRWTVVPSVEVFGTLSVEGLPERDLAHEHKTRITVGGPTQDLDIGATNGAVELAVRRKGSFDSVVIRPLLGEVQLDGQSLSSFAEEELQQDVVQVRAGGSKFMLTGVSPRRIRGIQWAKLSVLLTFLVFLNVVVWRIGP